MRPRTTHWQELVTVAETAAGGSNMKGDEDQVQNPTPTLLSWRTALTISQDKTELPIGAEFEAVTGVTLPSWPFVNVGVSFLAGFLLVDVMRYLVHRCEHAVPFLWRFHALHHLGSRCRCDDLGAPSSDRVRLGVGCILGGRDRARYFRCCCANPWPRSVPVRPASSIGISAFPTGLSAGCSRCWSRSTCTASITRSCSTRRTRIIGGRPIGMGSVLRNLYEPQPRAARQDRLRGARTTAARLPETGEDDPDTLVARPRYSCAEHRSQNARALVPVSMSALRLSAATRPSMPSFFRIAANSERRVATSLIAPSR